MKGMREKGIAVILMRRLCNWGFLTLSAVDVLGQMIVAGGCAVNVWCVPSRRILAISYLAREPPGDIWLSFG